MSDSYNISAGGSSAAPLSILTVRGAVAGQSIGIANNNDLIKFKAVDAPNSTATPGLTYDPATGYFEPIAGFEGWYRVTMQVEAYTGTSPTGSLSNIVPSVCNNAAILHEGPYNLHRLKNVNLTQTGGRFGVYGVVIRIQAGYNINFRINYQAFQTRNLNISDTQEGTYAQFERIGDL